MRRRLVLLGTAALLALPPAVPAADQLPDLGEVAQGDFSPLAERRVGEAILAEIRLREPSYLDDAEVTSYLNRIGSRLASQTEDGRQEFEFFALRDPTLNAFAMPGGYIGVHTGLILAAQSESELASVLAHEISHVTQRHLARLMQKSSQGQLASAAALAVAILAARSSPDLAMGAMAAGQAASVQNQLNFSRDFEREADRLGLGLLERSGFDIRGMSAFFERLQQFGRLYENNAPGYLRTHPLTTERIADMGNRIQSRPYRQAADSLDFQLVRAKLKALEGTGQDAVTDFETRLKGVRYGSEAATRYGLARARMRLKQWPAAEREVGELRRLKIESPMVESLVADLRRAQNDPAGAASVLRAAHARYPQDRGIVYGLAESLLDDRRAEEALKVASEDLLSYPGDARLHALQARSYAELGRRMAQHRAQAEAYLLNGQLLAAIEQLQLAQKAGDGDFYEQSQVDARLRELKRRQADEAKNRRLP